MQEINRSQLHWLIVEDALKNKQGHWFEYATTFWKGLTDLGDKVTILADQEAEPFIKNQLPVLSILPPSIWHKMGDKAGFLTRYARVPIHAWKTINSIKKHLTECSEYDVIFVPTVLVHHLLAWTWLIKKSLRYQSAKIILFFPNAPITHNINNNKFAWERSPSTILLRWLLNFISSDVRSGKVILGSETRAMQKVLSTLSGLSFTYFPHPVLPIKSSETAYFKQKKIIMGSYGSSRHEKGSDTLFLGIAKFTEIQPNAPVYYMLQCIEGFDNERQTLEQAKNITWIKHYFDEGEYSRYLEKTNVMILPYRLSSYTLRVSRVVIESIVNGIPVIATLGTTLAEQANEFGVLIPCEENNTESLATAIRKSIESYSDLQTRATSLVPSAQAHFSVQHFKACFLTSQNNTLF